MAKQSSPEMSSLAGRVMAGYWPDRQEVLALAACVLSQDETKGQEPQPPQPEDTGDEQWTGAGASDEV